MGGREWGLFQNNLSKYVEIPPIIVSLLQTLKANFSWVSTQINLQNVYNVH